MGRELKSNPKSAAERYAWLGFPDKYRVTLSDGGYRPVVVYLDQWMPRHSRLTGRYLGHRWVRIEEEGVPGGPYWEDKDVDAIAKAWLFEIARHDRLRDVPPPTYWTEGRVNEKEEQDAE